VQNRISALKKKYELPFGSSSSPKKASDAAGANEPAVPKTPSKNRVTKTKGGRTSLPSGKVPGIGMYPFGLLFHIWSFMAQKTLFLISSSVYFYVCLRLLTPSSITGSAKGKPKAKKGDKKEESDEDEDMANDDNAVKSPKDNFASDDEAVFGKPDIDEEASDEGV
jgi:hypothetical protein